MTAQIIDGKKIAEDIRAELKVEVDKLVSNTKITPGLAVILVGDDPASQVYVRNKKKACESVGIMSSDYRLGANTTEKELADLIDHLNRDDEIHGILLQLPLPKQLTGRKFLELIDPRKDVDGFHPENVGRFVIGEPGLRPCTPAGVMELLSRIGVDPAGKNAVIFGRSDIVGKPMAMFLLHAHATVAICHSRTRDIYCMSQPADIVVAAVGKPKFVTADMVKEGAVVIDVGINRTDEGLVGDVDYDSVKDKAGWITPVPGGVGPMTIAMLLKNTLDAYKTKLGL